MTKKQAIELMLEEPNLIRRPLVLSGRNAVFGFDAAKYEELSRK
jgi:arsenate reductase-like glutaredoxin family protein